MIFFNGTKAKNLLRQWQKYRKQPDTKKDNLPFCVQPSKK